MLRLTLLDLNIHTPSLMHGNVFTLLNLTAAHFIVQLKDPHICKYVMTHRDALFIYNRDALSVFDISVITSKYTHLTKAMFSSFCGLLGKSFALLIKWDFLL